MPYNNPFIYGNPVLPEQLIGRNKELREIAGRIGTGQSTIITGSPRSGKTSVLEYLMASETQAKLYDDEAEQLKFSYWNASTGGPQFDQVQFWQYVLKPLQKCIFAQGTDSPLFKAYQNCQETRFESHELEKLIAQIRQANWRLVLFIDEFDFLLSHPILGAEFFGGLRTQSQRGKGALVLVITANISRAQLDKKTRQFNPTGSPYFNFAEVVFLGALSDTEVDKLLLGDTYFTDKDHQFIKDIAGGHPYLLQVAASILWNYRYDQKNQKSVGKLDQQVEQDFYTKVQETLNSIWNSWDENRKKTGFTCLSTAQPKIFKEMKINVEDIIKEIPDYQMELNELRQYGFVAQNNKGGWQIIPKVFLDFVLEKFKEFYRKQHDRKKNGRNGHWPSLPWVKRVAMALFTVIAFLTLFGERVAFLFGFENAGEILSWLCQNIPIFWWC
jgi:hypothetical protein